MLLPCTARTPEKTWTEVAENVDGEVVPPPQAAHSNTNPSTQALMGPFVSANGRSAATLPPSIRLHLALTVKSLQPHPTRLTVPSGAVIIHVGEAS